jgi:hypothetical protein
VLVRNLVSRTAVYSFRISHEGGICLAELMDLVTGSRNVGPLATGQLRETGSLASGDDVFSIGLNVLTNYLLLCVRRRKQMCE